MHSVCSGIFYLASTFLTAQISAQNETFSGTIVQVTACCDGERGLLKHLRAAISASKVMLWLKLSLDEDDNCRQRQSPEAQWKSHPYLKRGSSGQDLAPMQQVLKISVLNDTFLIMLS